MTELKVAVVGGADEDLAWGKASLAAVEAGLSVKSLISSSESEHFGIKGVDYTFECESLGV